MRKYLATLPDKPDHHKKRFAFLVSLSFTAFIFVIWSLVNFGLPERETIIVERREVKTTENSPFNTIENGVAAGFKALTGQFGEIKQGLEQVNVESEYEDMRGRAFETYGR